MNGLLRIVRRAASGMLCLWLAASVQAAPGSWVGDTAGVRLFTPGRMVESDVIEPPSTVAADAAIRSLSWRFQVPAGQPRPQAWLCHPQGCIRLGMARGRSQALADLTASAPLHFRFRLPEGARPAQPFQATGLQVIVDYR